MGIEVKEAAALQTVTGQPVDGVTTEPETSLLGQTGAGDGIPDIVVAPETPASETTPEKVTPVTTEIAPEALRQITALSSSNRELKRKLAELEAKVSGQATPEDVQAKLTQLAALENETPRQYLKRTNKTLEDIAADVLVEDKEVADPRVDALTPVIDDLKKRLEAAEALRKTETETSQAQTQSKLLEEAHAYVKDIIVTSPDRWSLIKDDANIATEVVKAAMLVAKRDYADKVTGNVKQLTKEQSDAILQECLDEAETYALAKKLVADRKNTVQASESLVKRKGLEVQDSEAYTPRKGSDGKRADGARTPKVTIDGNRAPTRSAVVQRGPTDVRTARARMLRIAGAGSDDTK